jgi:class 3 adenylate cyclase/tetratricopeptide (TPR) repeat protein
METRKLAVIMFTDMVGYSKKVQANEDEALELLKEHNAILEQQILAYRGRIIKTIGDAFLADFDSVFNAVQSAVDIQKKLVDRNRTAPSDRRIEVRIGIHLGDVIYRDNDVFGDGVNIASRIQSLADAGQVFISHDVYSITLGKLSYEFSDLGSQELKNISRPIHVYEVVWDPQHPKGIHRPGVHATRRTVPWKRRAGVTVGVLGVAAALWYYLFVMPTPKKATSSRPTLALLSFSNQTQDDHLQRVHIGKIITDAMVQKFYEFPHVQLISPIRIAKIVRSLHISEDDLANNPDLAEKVGREANSRLMINGKLSKIGNTFILSADLNDLEEERLLATYVVREDMEESILGVLIDSLCMKFQHKITEMFEVKDTSASSIRLEDLTTSSLEAYHHFVKGYDLHVFGRSVEAIDEFEKAVALDSNFALAWSLMGCVYSFAKMEDRMPPHYLDKIRSFNDRFKGTSKEALIFRGNLGWVNNDEQQCFSNYRLITELYPDDREGYYYLALYLHYVKHDFAKAIEQYELGLALTPDYYPLQRDRAYAVKEARGVDEAVKTLQEFIRQYPTAPGVDLARKQIVELRSGSSGR